MEIWEETFEKKKKKREEGREEITNIWRKGEK